MTTSDEPSLAGAAAICRGTRRLLSSLGQGSLTELILATGRRVDIMAIDRRAEILVVEVKSSIADFNPTGNGAIIWRSATGSPLPCRPISRKT